MPGLLTLLALGLALLWAAMVLYIARRLSRPPRRTYAWAVARSLPGDPGELDEPLEFEDLRVGDPGFASLPVWSIRGGSPRGPVLIFLHGWGQSRLAVLPRLATLAPLCARVYAPDLPGHGEATGRSALGAQERERLGGLLRLAQDEAAAGGTGRPVLYGFSMGAGIAIDAAAHAPDLVGGVIAEAPYRVPATPARAVLRDAGIPYRLTLRPALFLAALVRGGDPLWRRFDRAPLAARLRCPLLVLHATGDAICPATDGEAIAAEAERGRWVPMPGDAHAGVWNRPSPAREIAARAVAEALTAPVR